MILNAILNFVLLIFSPLVEAINIGVDFLLGFSYVKTFLQVVVYVLPWNNLVPLIAIIVWIIGFRVVISLIKTLWELIPVL